MDEELDIVVIGFDVDDRLAEAGLMRVFGLDSRHARRFVRELPVAAKRCANAATAERYVSALRSIGAQLELRPANDAQPPSGRPRTLSSLPIPAPSILAHVDESARIDRETARAIARFRAHEGLDGSVPALEVDPVNPRIPKAPLLPHDLAQMPNAELPRFDRPDWMLSDPLTQGVRDGAPSTAQHIDAERPPRPSTVPAPRSTRPAAPAALAAAAAASAADTPPPPALDAGSVPPNRVIGLAHAATASVRPGLSLFSSWRPAGMDPRKRHLRRYWPLAVALVALAVAALAWFGAFDSESTRRAKTWRALGIDPGDYAEAAWFDHEGHELRGASPAQVRNLLGKLSRAGAPGVYALRIVSTERGQSADALLIELPEASDARQTILWHAAKSRGDALPLIPDDGRPVYVLEFQR